MHHRLFIAGLEIAKIRVFLKGLANSGDVAVTENAKTAGEEFLLYAVSFNDLVFQEFDDSLSCG